MDNKDAAIKIVVGAIGVSIGLAFLKAGGGRILDGLEGFAHNLSKTIKES